MFSLQKGPWHSSNLIRISSDTQVPRVGDELYTYVLAYLLTCHSSTSSSISLSIFLDKYGAQHPSTGRQQEKRAIPGKNTQPLWMKPWLFYVFSFHFFKILSADPSNIASALLPRSSFSCFLSWRSGLNHWR